VKISLGIFFAFFFSLSFWAQDQSYNQCKGAVYAPLDGAFQIKFLGKAKNNQIWLVFIAPNDGDVVINLRSSEYFGGKLYLTNESLCELTGNGSTTGDLSFESIPSGNYQNIKKRVEKNQQLTLVIEGKAKSIANLDVNTSFVIDDQIDLRHQLNLVYDAALPTYSLIIRDDRSMKPISSRIIIQGNASLNGTYFASDLYMNLNQRVRKLNIKIDAPGYFPLEFKEQSLPFKEVFNDTIYLHAFEKGELTKLEQVYFGAGVPEILEESYPQLNRLRDFLLLNPTVSIEIHGHVNIREEGEGEAKKLSKQRAMMVKKYLVENGISANRLFPIGFGDSKPVFANPQNEEQKEANRRVEILIRTN
jgi:outer membrane protein OmpA-like peptidoglycan-associated protein